MEYNRVVLFGAGASFGSPAVLPVPPPLGADLYGVLAKAFPETWGGVSDELRAKFEDHFETGMSALWDMYPAALSSLKPGAPSPHRLMQDMARLFMCYSLAPGADDLYTRFLIELWNASKGKNTFLSTAPPPIPFSRTRRITAVDISSYPFGPSFSHQSASHC